jgi:hypothetical protein
VIEPSFALVQLADKHPSLSADPPVLEPQVVINLEGIDYAEVELRILNHMLEKGLV